jgi:outer membrane biosynthesis protein TonB
MARSRFYSLSVAASLLALVPGFAVRAGPPVAGNDYPTESLKAGEQGTAWYIADVTETGVPENCVILVSSGWPGPPATLC